jgi:hypothetical protein
LLGKNCSSEGHKNKIICGSAKQRKRVEVNGEEAKGKEKGEIYRIV